MLVFYSYTRLLFFLWKVNLSILQLRVCKYRNPLRPLRVQIPPFVTCGDIFPRPGEVFPLRGSFMGAFRQLQRARPSWELAKPPGFDWEGLCCPDKFRFVELSRVYHTLLKLAKGRIPSPRWYPAFACLGSRPVLSTKTKRPDSNESGGIFLDRHSYALGTAG